MLAVFGLVFPLFALVFLGFGAGKIFKVPIDGLAWMNIFIIYIALPAMFFKLLSGIDLSQFVGFSFLAITTFTTLVVFALSFLFGVYTSKGSVPEATIQGFAGAYGNIGYMGPPLALAAFGAASIGLAALIFCFDNALHFILAPMLMAIGKPNAPGGLKLAGQVFYKIFTHPFIVSTIIGILAAAFAYVPPTPVAKIIDLLAAAAAPCALFTMGVSAALRPVKRVPMELAFLVPVKLVLHPLLIWFLLTNLGDFPPIAVATAVLMAALPSATNVFVLAQQYEVWQERASSAVVISTALAIVSVTITLYLMGASA